MREGDKNMSVGPVVSFLLKPNKVHNTHHSPSRQIYMYNQFIICLLHLPSIKETL